MELVVKNFGPIKECKIDLSKKYYFFVGYNNTGKTYLSSLVYEIFSMETLTEFSKIPLEFLKIEEENPKDITLSKDLVKEILEKFALFLKKSVVPKLLRTNGNSDFILKDLEIYFEFDFEKDVEGLELESSVSIGPKGMTTNVFTLRKDVGSSDIKYVHYTNEDIIKKIPQDFFKVIPRTRFEGDIHHLKKNVGNIVTQSILSLLLRKEGESFFLPANRIFILENADELVEQSNKRNEEFTKSLVELLESKEDNKEKLSNILAKRAESKYAAPINSLIEKISELRRNKDEDFIQKGTGFYDDILTGLSDLMGGEIIVSKPAPFSNGVEKFKIGHGAESRILNMSLASSSVNQLGTFFQYLKYWAKAEGNFLMIDEPEENLHPKSQLKLMNLLLTFANKDNRILITTHSPLVAEIINNYLVLSQLENKEQLCDELELANTDISLETAAVYYFNGEVVTEHKLGSYGTIFTSFKEVQEKVYNTGEYLSDLLFEKLNKS